VVGKEWAHIEMGEVSALDHELGNDAMEDGALVVERLSHLAYPLLACKCMA